MITHGTIIFNDIRTDILNYKEKINPKKLKDLLDESEINGLEIKLNAIKEIFKNKE